MSGLSEAASFVHLSDGCVQPGDLIVEEFLPAQSQRFGQPFETFADRPEPGSGEFAAGAYRLMSFGYGNDVAEEGRWGRVVVFAGQVVHVEAVAVMSGSGFESVPCDDDADGCEAGHGPDSISFAVPIPRFDLCFCFGACRETEALVGRRVVSLPSLAGGAFLHRVEAQLITAVRPGRRPGSVLKFVIHTPYYSRGASPGVLPGLVDETAGCPQESRFGVPLGGRSPDNLAGCHRLRRLFSTGTYIGS